MSSYDWIALVTLGLDRWNEPAPPRTTYEIERKEAWDKVEAHLAAKRRARRKALLQSIKRVLTRMFTPRSPAPPPRGRPQKPASRV